MKSSLNAGGLLLRLAARTQTASWLNHPPPRMTRSRGSVGLGEVTGSPSRFVADSPAARNENQAPRPEARA